MLLRGTPLPPKCTYHVWALPLNPSKSGFIRREHRISEEIVLHWQQSFFLVCHVDRDNPLESVLHTFIHIEQDTALSERGHTVVHRSEFGIQAEKHAEPTMSKQSTEMEQNNENAKGHLGHISHNVRHFVQASIIIEIDFGSVGRVFNIVKTVQFLINFEEYLLVLILVFLFWVLFVYYEIAYCFFFKVINNIDDEENIQIF